MKQESTHTTAYRQKLVMVILGLVFIAPLVGAWVAFYFTGVGRDEPGSSYGELILPPRPVEDLLLIDPNEKGRRHHLHGKWNIVYLISGTCDPVCENKLYIMRQVRLALGQDAHRVQRVLIVYGQGAHGLTDLQTRAFAGQLLAPGTDQVFNNFKLTDTDWPVNLRRLYIIDPLGNLMMKYADGMDPSGMIKDLKRLLKYSRIG